MSFKKKNYQKVSPTVKTNFQIFQKYCIQKSKSMTLFGNRIIPSETLNKYRSHQSLKKSNKNGLLGVTLNLSPQNRNQINKSINETVNSGLKLKDKQILDLIRMKVHINSLSQKAKNVSFNKGSKLRQKTAVSPEKANTIHKVVNSNRLKRKIRLRKEIQFINNQKKSITQKTVRKRQQNNKSNLQILFRRLSSSKNNPRQTPFLTQYSIKRPKTVQKHRSQVFETVIEKQISGWQVKVEQSELHDLTKFQS